MTVVFGDIDSDIVTFFSTDIGLNILNLDDNFDNCNTETISHAR